MIRLVLIELIAISLFMTGMFVVAILEKRNDVADVVWGLGFVLATVVALLLQSELATRALLVSVLVFIWGGRLALRIFLRNRKKKEDKRYKQWRQEWGKYFYLITFLQVFMLQGLLILVIVSPVVWTIYQPSSSLNLLDMLGLVVWLTGFTFEAVGDYQLDQFKKDPAGKGKIMQTGLWHYSRHPNYFGEVSLWWGVYIIALSVPHGWLTIFGPLTITFLILKVSGIPLLEKHYEGNQAFEEYKKRTSAFFPMPPKKEV